MNESEGNDAIVFPQQAVAGEQCFGEPANAVNEVLLAFAVVVQVDLDVSDSMRRHMFQRFHEVGSILLLGIEKQYNGGDDRQNPETSLQRPANRLPIERPALPWYPHWHGARAAHSDQQRAARAS